MAVSSNASVSRLLATVQKCERPFIRQAGAKALQRSPEYSVRLDNVEQGEAGAELHGVDGAQNLLSAPRTGPRKQRLDRPLQGRSQLRMGEIRSRLVERTYAVVPGGRASAEAGKLGKDEPHPMAFFPAAAQLRN